MMIVLRIRGMRLRIIMSGMIVVVVMAALGASVFGGIVILGGVVIVATMIWEGDRMNASWIWCRCSSGSPA